MSDSDRERDNQTESWFFPIVGLLLAIGLAFGVGFLHGGENERRYSAPHQHRQSAEKRALNDCRGADRANVIKCAQEQIQAGEEAARGEQDLTAQQQAAWAAIYNTMIAAVVLIITGVGTALIYEQIKLTRKAVEDTGKATVAMEEQNRIAREAGKPMVVLSLANFSHGEYPDGMASLSFDLVATNVSQIGCAIEGFSSDWGTANDSPNILTGAVNIVALPSGATETVFRFMIAKQAVRERPILRGFVNIAGPMLERQRGLVRFSFHVFLEEIYPTKAHYKRHLEAFWSDMRVQG